MILTTVNVLEIIDLVPHQIISFKDDATGNKEAEKMFTQIAKENDANDVDMKMHLDNGFYTIGDYGVYLIHS